MNWTQDVPTKPGRYLMFDEYYRAVVLVKLQKYDGVIRHRDIPINANDGPWFGPIPDPPERSET